MMDWDRSVHQLPRVSKEMLNKTLTLASLNARGLGTNSPKQKAIKLWLASLPSPPKSSSSRNTTWEKKAQAASEKESSFGRELPSGIQGTPWEPHRKLALALPSF
jgi:hypothetical protein